MIIPIGVDCGVADFLKRYNLRHVSSPFDWVVTYNGVSACIDDGFKHFIPISTDRINKYNIYFHHDFAPETYAADKVKYNRRIERFKSMLESSTEEHIFIRKGHAPHHHGEHSGKYTVIKSDIEDVADLDRILAIKYPSLKYKIILTVVCGKCYDPSNIYISSDRVKIYNTVSAERNDEIFETTIKKILKL